MTQMMFEPLKRGELILSHERLLELNSQLEQFCFRFELLEHAHSSKKIPKLDPVLEPKTKRRSTFSVKSDWSEDVLEYGDGDEIVFNKRPTRVRKQPLAFVEEFYDEITVAPTKRSERHHHDHHASGSSSGSHQQHYNRQHDHKMGKSSGASLYKTVSNILKTLPKLQKDTWEYTCYRILQIVKYMDTDKWFWYPVDPIADGVPNYTRIIKHPMDFQTVIERLHKGHYSNPFQWQTDMRQIFYNAFKFYKSDNVIWQAALRVSTQFEAKLASTRFVNCDEFAELLKLAPETAKAALLSYNEETFARKGVPSRKLRDGLDEIPEVLGKRRGGRKVLEYDYGADGAADGAGDDQGSEYDDASYMGSSDEQNSPDEYISMDVYHGRNKRMGHRKLGGASHRGYYLAAGPIPAVGHVPPPPPFQTVGINDKSLSLAQQRTLDFNLTRLAPNQRRAALELVEDDLGILAELFKDDVTFTFDASLLPIEKQRRIFLYVNQMARRNEGMMHAQAIAGSMTKRSGVKRRLAASGRAAGTVSDEDDDGDDEDGDDDLDADYDEDDLIVAGGARGRTSRRDEHLKMQFDRRRKSKRPAKEYGSNQVFDDTSSSLSDVASNFLSSDEFFSSSDDDDGTNNNNNAQAKRQGDKHSKGGVANSDAVEDSSSSAIAIQGAPVNATTPSANLNEETATSIADSFATSNTTSSSIEFNSSALATEAVDAHVHSKGDSSGFIDLDLDQDQDHDAIPLQVQKVPTNSATHVDEFAKANQDSALKGKSVANLPEYRPVDDDDGQGVILASTLGRRLVAAGVDFLDKDQDNGNLSSEKQHQEETPQPRSRAMEPSVGVGAATSRLLSLPNDVSLDHATIGSGRDDPSRKTDPGVYLHDEQVHEDNDNNKVQGKGKIGIVAINDDVNANGHIAKLTNADNIATVGSGAEGDDDDDDDEAKSRAWMEWKGQVIHHGIVAQQNGMAPRNDDEKIAEGFDARI